MAFKTSYVRNVFDALPKAVEPPNDKSLQSKTLVEQIAAISPVVVLVKVKKNCGRHSHHVCVRFGRLDLCRILLVL